MAFDFSKLNFLNKLDARARIFVLTGGIIGVVFLVYLGTTFLSGGEEATGPTRVASAPQGLQTIPGGQETPEFRRAIEQANLARAQQAQLSGTSAVPTMINIGQPGAGPSTSACVICTDDAVNVKSTLDDWIRQGKITPETAALLQKLADQNVPVSEYAAMLDQLVKEGKLTPEQARQLLEQYKKQHANNLLDESAKAMDEMIKSGQLPLDVSNQLLAAQKANMSPAEYAAMLQELVKQGKLSPEAAQQLLAQYTQQRTREIVNQSIATLHQMARAGQITPEIEKEMVDLENRMVPIDTYTAALQRFVQQGKLIPMIAGKILDEYKYQKTAIGPTGSVNKLLQKAEADAYGEISDLLKAGKISPDTANILRGMIQKNVSLDEFKSTVNALLQQQKLTPELAKLKIADYVAVKGYRDLQERLGNLQANNATTDMYADELKKAVQDGLLTPEQAAQLMKEYQAVTMKTAGVGGAPAPIAGAEDFAKLQQRLQEAGGGPAEAVTTDQFVEARQEAQLETAQERQARLEALVNVMSGQAQQLVAAWQPPVMAHKEGSAALPGKDKADAAADGKKGEAGTASASITTTAGASLIKAGSILFAVLDTAVNSDYPDSPVMATIVDGKYKGAKLLGKLATTKGVSGQMDRVSLNFTMMNMEAWPKSKTVTAYAIDPDTARTVLATSVDYHYLKRYGAVMATSFIQGYANAILNAGTSTTGIFGTSTTSNPLSPSSKIAVALGQIGQNLGDVTKNYTNIPPTVKVDSGVGLGILFMSDVT